MKKVLPAKFYFIFHVRPTNCTEKAREKSVNPQINQPWPYEEPDWRDECALIQVPSYFSQIVVPVMFLAIQVISMHDANR